MKEHISCVGSLGTLYLAGKMPFFTSASFQGHLDVFEIPVEAKKYSLSKIVIEIRYQRSRRKRIFEILAVTYQMI